MDLVTRSRELVAHDVFLISNRNGNLVYSPLRGILFWASENATELIVESLLGNISVPQQYPLIKKYVNILSGSVPPFPKQRAMCDSSHAVIILSQKCNLACVYCYAQEARSSDVLSKEKLKCIIDYNIGKKSFSFIGGGEPFVTWNLLKWAIEYIRDFETGDKELSYIGITTNGTFLDEERVSFLKANSVDINLSFDILPEIQNKQRPFANGNSTFDVVDHAIELLFENDIIPSIRSTITLESIYLMNDMVTFVAQRYPKIKRLHFEHVTDQGLNFRNYYSDFVSEYFKAKDIAEAAGIQLRNSIISSLERVSMSFCYGEYCITPQGDIVSCHRVSSNSDPNYNRFSYGSIFERKVHIDEARLKEIRIFYENKYEKCDMCFAKWHCAGGCPQNRAVFPSYQFDDYCLFTKK